MHPKKPTLHMPSTKPDLPEDMSKRNLLLCFDAFGTLFTPKQPIAQQYGDVARSLGLGGFTDKQVQDSFKQAFRQEAKQNPNFGKANGMNAGKWWTNVRDGKGSIEALLMTGIQIIHNTFQPLVGANQQIHTELAPRLLYRFASEEGYVLKPGVLPLLHGLRDRDQRTFGRTVIGVVTNSDDRVPGILTSLGLRVSPLTYGSNAVADAAATEYDIDFAVMSYDVGHEKPDKRIFAAAEDMLKSNLAVAGADLSTWDKVYVGDEYEKDVVGARDAGWYAVLVNENGSGGHEDVKDLDHANPGNLLQHLRERHPAVVLSSLERLAQWLCVHSTP